MGSEMCIRDRVGAASCEIDHVVPFDEGGQTVAENLQCLSTRGHTRKTKGQWDASMTPDGVVEWTSLTGRTHTTHAFDDGELPPVALRARLPGATGSHRGLRGPPLGGVDLERADGRVARGRDRRPHAGAYSPVTIHAVPWARHSRVTDRITMLSLIHI